jgi:hypothetical protein
VDAVDEEHRLLENGLDGLDDLFDRREHADGGSPGC